MKKLINYLPLAVVLLFLAGCSEQFNQDLPVHQQQEALEAFEFLQQFEDDYGDVIDLRREMSPHQHGKTTTKWDLTKNADYNYYDNIDGSQYECDVTDFRTYIAGTYSDWSSYEFAVFNGWYWLLFDYYFVFANTTVKGETYGLNGHATNDINRDWKSINRFWDNTNTIALASAKGSFWKDTSKIVDILTLENDLFWGAFTPAQIKTLAVNLKAAYGSSGFDNYTHPMLSLNAFAASPFELPDFTTAYKIVMGDGIMDAYKALGLGDVAPQAILAHEYAHHMQFYNDVTFSGTPEGTRGTELMADALAAYYLTHKKGATMNWKRYKQFLSVFYNIGDCAFGSNNHHGTPAQRMRAAQWGYDYAEAQKVKGTVSASADIIADFEDDVDDIIED